MSLTVQNLRAVGTGVEPASLLPGQIAFNITDKVLYVGDGSNFKTDFEGNQVAGTPGAGWYAMPMDFGALGSYYVANPEVYGDVPTDQQVLTWSDALDHPIWTTGSGAGGNQVYVVTNAAVASAPGATTSAKITAAIGVASPDEGDVTIVTGLPDDVYEGLYFFTTSWVKGAAYAYPSASEVIYNNTGRTLGATVQAAIDDLDDGLIATTSIANTANSTANSALSIASAALPRAGGVMTGNITFQNAGQGVTFNGGSAVHAISDSVSTTSSTTSASATAVKSAHDLAAAAVPRSSFVSPGDLLVGTGAGTFSPLPAGAADYILASDGAGGLLWVPDSEGDVTGVAVTAPITVDNTDPQVPVIGVNLATTATPGVVQIELTGNLTLVGGVINVPNASTTVKGAVQLYNSTSGGTASLALTAAAGSSLQSQIDALNFANSVTLAGGYNATTGLVDGATSQGNAAGFFDGFAPPAPAAGNLDYYLICTTAGPLPSAMQNGDWLLSDGTQYVVLGVGARPQSASYTDAGIVQLADAAAVLAGTSDTLAITPQALQDNIIDSVTTANSSQMASATAVKTAYDAAVAAQTTANAALPKVGGTMTGNITFQDVGEGVIFSNLSSVVAISDSVSTSSATTAASSNAVKTAYDAGIQGQTDAAAAQADADQALLDAAAAQATADAAVPCASFTALGELLAGTGAGTYSALTVGSNGQVLLANSSCSTGLEWGNACYVPDACFTAKGQLIVGTGTGTYVALSPGTNGQLLVPNSACANGVEWVTCSSLSLCGYTCVATPFNTALGFQAGDSITTGTGNTSIGFCAGTALTSGNGNTVVGRHAGLSVTGIANLTAIGVNSVTTAATGAGTTAVGANTLAILSSGAQNTAIGSFAGTAVTTGGCNTFLGAGSGSAVNSGSNNTFLGYLAGDAATSASSNVFIGSNAGSIATIGSQNIFIGVNAGDGVTTGFNNTIIGDISGTAALTDTLILGTGTTVRFQANASGAWSYNGTDFGTAGQFLASQGSAATPVWCTLSLACVPCSAFTAVGDILVGTGAATYSALPLGTSGQALVVDTTCASGVKWVTASGLNLAGFTCSATPFNTALGANAGAAFTINSVANTAIGYNALDSETSGDFNIAVGHNALCSQNGASNNIAVGANAGSSITTGGTNIIIGHNAGDSLTTGSANTFIGFGAGQATTGGNDHVAIGYGAMCNYTGNTLGMVAIGLNALCSLTSGLCNTAIGYNAAAVLTTGGCNVAIGSRALDSAVGGAGNVAVGVDALTAVTSGDFNTAVGFLAADAMGTGANNVSIGYSAHGSSNPAQQVAIGKSALQSSSATGSVGVGFEAALNSSTGLVTAVGYCALRGGTTGTCNTAVGYNAGAAYTGSNSTFIGHGAGDIATSGNSNTFIGANSGGAVTTGAGNILIGDTAGDAITTGSNNTIIGDIAGSAALTNNLILAAGTTTKLQVNENGAVGVGSTPSYGTSGQLLSSTGTGGAATWTSSIPLVTPPTASTDPGVEGQVAADGTHFFMYTGGRWQRINWDPASW